MSDDAPGPFSALGSGRSAELLSASSAALAAPIASGRRCLSAVQPGTSSPHRLSGPSRTRSGVGDAPPTTTSPQSDSLVIDALQASHLASGRPHPIGSRQSHWAKYACQQSNSCLSNTSRPSVTRYMIALEEPRDAVPPGGPLVGLSELEARRRSRPTLPLNKLSGAARRARSGDMMRCKTTRFIFARKS